MKTWLADTGFMVYRLWVPMPQRFLMKYLLLVAIALPNRSWSQANVAGLGNYVIGNTTPSSLNLADFKEEAQSYVKGTIALPCTHIRTFTSARTEASGLPLTNVGLLFYDNSLFSIICDYSNTLKRAFTEHHGPGIRKPISRLRLCHNEKDKLLLLWADAWAGMDVLAQVTYIKGYTADCTPKEEAQLWIVNQKIVALSSECDLKQIPPYADLIDKSQKESQERHRP